MSRHEITREDILEMSDYAASRKQRRAAVTEMKKDRRAHIGPDATFYFENYDTMFHQIHEMLYIEGGGEDQIEDELSAYNPMIPKGRELVATLMFEIDDADRRAKFLEGLGGVEETVTISIDGDEVKAVPEADIDRTSAEGKASSIQFLHFPFTDAQVEKFRSSEAKVVLGIGHQKYGHMAALTGAVKDALAGDFD
ncbi:MAG: DUF3501 family protein [Rhodospirillaceae bacterium]|jgi:hypothetical protein|nr:DUF3501 family protein [Rhodospirillaceae bacterium]MBT4219235.1 DUF3501 family protein [Rhodospirillaceae bacterium]MBT4463157.1 DUF3501 family protein [Rhodospirillaceae bacterium]MBT5014414.1 DUF3501 family protein [Rhodospirillaceae bacterium]MBT5309685.1 DUF3501 family protein [Rhodospirillaceae bacterium]